ncbi:MAG: hypothetical protein K6U11_00315 [bacterium]|nr:hypothetical protein [bacterium]
MIGGIIRFFKDFLKDEEGVFGAEYALLLCLIALMVSFGATVLGQEVKVYYIRVADYCSRLQRPYF